MQTVKRKQDSMELDDRSSKLLHRDRLPVCLTSGFHGDAQSADLTAEEEPLMDRIISVTVDSSGRLIGTPS